MRNNTLLKITVGIVVAFGIALAVVYTGYGELDRLSNYEDRFAGRSIENGAKLFETNCIGCHGVQGQGIPGVAPALNSEAFFTTRLQDVGYSGSLQSYIELTIASGRPVGSGQYAAVMPTWGEEYGGPLRPDQVGDLASYILNWESTAVAAGGGGETTATAPASSWSVPPTTWRSSKSFWDRGCCWRSKPSSCSPARRQESSSSAPPTRTSTRPRPIRS